MRNDRNSPAPASAVTADLISERSAGVAGAGVSGGPGELETVRELVAQHQHVAVLPRIARGWRRLGGRLAGHARGALQAIVGRIVSKHRANRRTRVAPAAGLPPNPGAGRWEGLVEPTEQRRRGHTGLAGEPTVLDAARLFVEELRARSAPTGAGSRGETPCRVSDGGRAPARRRWQTAAERVVPKHRRAREVRTALEVDLERKAVVIRRDSKAFAEQTEHRRRIHARRVATAAGLGLHATASRLARSYQLNYGRPVRVPPRRGRVTLPSERPGGRRLPAGRAPAGRGPATSRGSRGSPGRASPGDLDLPPEKPADIARPRRALLLWQRPGLGSPHRRPRGHIWRACSELSRGRGLAGLWGEEAGMVCRPGECRSLVHRLGPRPVALVNGGDAIRRGA